MSRWSRGSSGSSNKGNCEYGLVNWVRRIVIEGGNPVLGLYSDGQTLPSDWLYLSMKSELEAIEQAKATLEESIRGDQEYLTTLPPQLDKLLTSTTQVPH